MTEGTVFNIQKFCINDGPGIRTTVFFKGCPLDCVWCHNPESKKIIPQLLFSEEKCTLCRKCLNVCENSVHLFNGGHTLDRARCNTCGKCEAVCRIKALEISGKKMSVGEVMKAVLQDKEFYEDSGGGVTFSGGEPFLQSDFLIELLRASKENGLHTCIETCGYASKEKILEAIPYTDIFLFDWKITDSTLHKKFTGEGNEKILENLKLLDSNGCKIILRCPIIPDVNDNEEHFKGIVSLAEACENVIGVDIAPYHELGISKKMRMGEKYEYSFTVPEEVKTEEYINAVKRYTAKTVKRM